MLTAPADPAGEGAPPEVNPVVEGEPSSARFLVVPSDRSIRPLSTAERIAVGFVVVLVLLLGFLGFANSFVAVERAVEPSFGEMAWTVPLGVDLGIFALVLLDLVLARLDMRVVWLRFGAWALTAVTIYLNVVDESTLVGRLGHASLVLLWVVLVEVGAHALRARAGLERGTAMDSIRMSRWLLAPWTTFRIFRRMILWEIRSYAVALTRERDRQLALTELQDRYGRYLWRFKAPRRERVLYRQGVLVPGEIHGGEPESDDDRGEESPDDQATVETLHGARGGSLPRDFAHLLNVAREVARSLADAGEELTRDTLAAGLRAAGESASNARVGRLLAVLKEERQG